MCYNVKYSSLLKMKAMDVMPEKPSLNKTTVLLREKKNLHFKYIVEQ